MRSREFTTASEAYLGVLADVLNNPEYRCAPRGQEILEVTDYMFSVTQPDANPIVTLDPERNVTIAEYTKKEKDLYNSCSNRVEDFAKASKFWNQIANSDGTINSAYGYLIWGNQSMGNPKYEHTQRPVLDPASGEAVSLNLAVYRTPWQWCVEALKSDPDTRQATLVFSLPEHFYKGVKDFTCTRHAQFQIRDNKLNMSVVMRSNDLQKGLVYDLPWFISLIYKMVDELKATYPNLQVGTYAHLAHSLHVYSKDVPAIQKMLGYESPG